MVKDLTPHQIRGIFWGLYLRIVSEGNRTFPGVDVPLSRRDFYSAMNVETAKCTDADGKIDGDELRKAFLTVCRGSR
jgi:hypothetical protein